MAREVVYIASCPHSGSTVLDLVLGAHPRFVGLGEVDKLLSEADAMARTAEEQCSCGRVMVECDFWAPTLETLHAHADASPTERYGLILDAFDAFFGEDKVLVDSSKYQAPLQTVAAVPDVDLKVVHLIRDVRAWVVSMRNARRRKNDFTFLDLLRNHGLRAFKELRHRSAAYYFGAWLKRNKRLHAAIAETGAPAFEMSYDEFCLDTPASVTRLCAFLGVEPVDAMSCPGESQSHSVFGNRMRGDSSKLGAILYDRRWLANRDWVRPAQTCHDVMAYNGQHVWPNIDPPRV